VERTSEIGILEPGSQQRLAPCLPALLAELVQLAPDLIWLHSTQAVVAAKQATTTVPIVIGVASDLVERGLVASLAQPGGTSLGWISVSLNSWQNSSKC
jgi:ABC-type uncharacterized transport system substrate-binding protein